MYVHTYGFHFIFIGISANIFVCKNNLVGFDEASVKHVRVVSFRLGCLDLINKANINLFL